MATARYLATVSAAMRAIFGADRLSRLVGFDTAVAWAMHDRSWPPASGVGSLQREQDAAN
ncbi:MAG: hypothetical protein IRZ03_15800 [Acidobacterium ailaaui]|nr:hypothetical protein [Pseudacidobacterium ailaaui]